MKRIYYDLWIIVVGTLMLTGVCVGILYPTKEDQHLKEANEFKRELIQHQQKLIEYQDTMINSLANTLWNEYNDDCAQFDGEEQDNIIEEKQIIDSLYNTQM